MQSVLDYKHVRAEAVKPLWNHLSRAPLKIRPGVSLSVGMMSRQRRPRDQPQRQHKRLSLRQLTEEAAAAVHEYLGLWWQLHRL